MVIIALISAKNVCVTYISVVLSVLQTYNSLQEVLVSFGRRVLTFPLFRHFAMVSAAIQDTAKILHSGEAP